MCLLILKILFKSTDLSIVVSGLITSYAFTYDASDVFVSILRFKRLDIDMICMRFSRYVSDWCFISHQELKGGSPAFLPAFSFRF